MHSLADQTSELLEAGISARELFTRPTAEETEDSFGRNVIAFRMGHVPGGDSVPVLHIQCLRINSSDQQFMHLLNRHTLGLRDAQDNKQGHASGMTTKPAKKMNTPARSSSRALSGSFGR